MAEQTTRTEDRRDIWNAPVVPDSTVLLRDLVTHGDVAQVVVIPEAVIREILEGTWGPEPGRRPNSVIAVREAVRLTARSKALSRLIRNVDRHEAPASYPAADRAAAMAALRILGMLAGVDGGAPTKQAFRA